MEVLNPEVLINAGGTGIVVLVVAFILRFMQLLVKRDESVVSSLIGENGKLHAQIAKLEEQRLHENTAHNLAISHLRERMFAAEEQEADCLATQTQLRAQIAIVQAEVEHLKTLLKVDH